MLLQPHYSCSSSDRDTSATLPRQRQGGGVRAAGPLPVAAADAVRGTRGPPPEIQGIDNLARYI